VRAIGSNGVEFALVPAYEDLVLLSFADFELSHLALSDGVGHVDGNQHHAVIGVVGHTLAFVEEHVS
jgi:hypothetical protein